MRGAILTEGTELAAYFKEACNTLKASRWQLFMARLFGKKIVNHDGWCVVTFYQYRGVLYLTDFENLEPMV